MHVVILEPDPLVGEDLRDAARVFGAVARLVRSVPEARTALRLGGDGAVLIVAAARFWEHRAGLAPEIGAGGARVVLFGMSDALPADAGPFAALPDPFTHDDVIRILTCISQR